MVLVVSRPGLKKPKIVSSRHGLAQVLASLIGLTALMRYETQMAQETLEAASRWPHFLFLVPRFLIGFFYVFLYFPIAWSWLHMSSLASTSALLPVEVFISFWREIVTDPSRFYVAAAASLIVGFLASDIVSASNVVISRPLLRFARKVKRLKAPLDESRRKLAIDSISGDVRFRIWLFHEYNGAPARVLDFVGFWVVIRSLFKHAFLMFAYLWVTWGVVAWFLLPSRYWLSPGWIQAVFLFFGILIGTGFLWYAFHTYDREGNRVMGDTWMKLYKMYVEDKKPKESVNFEGL